MSDKSMSMINKYFAIMALAFLILTNLSEAYPIQQPNLISCNLIANPVINGEYIDLKVFIHSVGDDFYLGKSTFSFGYDVAKLKFLSYLADSAIIFNNNSSKGYGEITSAPNDTSIAYRTIEINFDTLTKPTPSGLIVPNKQTYLGTLRFKILNKSTSFSFTWNPLTIIRTVNGANINVLCNKSEFQPFILYSAKLTSPAGKESFYPDRKTDIKWTSSGNFPIYIQFSINGIDWGNVEDRTFPSNKLTYTWTIPLANSEHCSIRLLDSASKFILSQTEEFSIFPGFSYFLRPSDGDALYYAGKSDIIQWTCEGYNKLKFEVTTDAGITWTLVANNVVASSKELTWKIPNATTKSAQLKMTDAETGKEICQSGKFKILQGSITFKNPILNETILVNKTYRIRWTSVNVSGFDLYYSTDNGKTWLSVANSLNAASAYYDWKVPITETKTAILRAIYNDDPEMEYGKTGVFIIKNPVGVEDDIHISRLYPNPASNFITIGHSALDAESMTHFGENIGWTVEIFNIFGTSTGSVTGSGFIHSSDDSKSSDEYYRIDISNLPAGIYFIKIGDRFEKFVKM